MAELPEIVRQRLVQQGRGDHPDADLLTAFAEKTLPERERAQVLAHLGTCAVCREIVALALPEAPVPQRAITPAAAGWLRWPVLRWGGLVAAMVVVVAAVAVRTSLRSRMAVSERPPTPAVAQQENAPTKAEAQAPAQAGAPTGEEHKALAKRKSPAAPRDQLQTNVTTAPPRTQAERERAQSIEAVPSASDAATSLAESGAKTVPGTPAAAETTYSRARAMPKAGVTGGVIGGVPGPSVATMKAQAGAARAPLLRVSAVPRWRVSDDGGLARSTDGGQTWQAVPVQGGGGFRTVSAVGDDIWAGGSGGVLFHSSNAGQTWARVAPRSGGVILNSDIVRVEFSDPVRGTVTAASGEVWFTADGGRTWTVRRP